MNFKISRKDIISMNEQFDTGSTINETSLDFAISYARKTTNWHKALAYVVRAILLDHVFEEGNKRTAALLIKTYSSFEGYEVDDKNLQNLIKSIILKNITSIRKIEELIHHAIK